LSRGANRSGAVTVASWNTSSESPKRELIGRKNHVECGGNKASGKPVRRSRNNVSLGKERDKKNGREEVKIAQSFGYQ